MKILMISESFLPKIGGLQYQMKYLVEELAKQDVDIYFMSYSNGEKFLKKNEHGFPFFIKLKNENLFLRILGIWEIFKNIRKVSPDIIHVHSAEISAFHVSVLKKLGLVKCPFIVTSHGIDIMTYPSIGYGLRRYKTFSIIVRFILKTCSVHTLVGKCMFSHALESGSNKEKIVVINNGVPEKNIKITLEKQQQVQEKFGLKESDFILLSLSGMRALKGIDILIKALVKIKAEISNVKLLLACESLDNYDQTIKKIISDLNLEQYVNFIGFVTEEDEKIALIRRCDIFCKPSRLEACSVAILEAMNEGRVVVASKPGGIDIINNRTDGILVETENPISFAEAVIEIYKNRDLREKIEQGAKINMENFYIQKIASQYIELYNKTI